MFDSNPYVKTRTSGESVWRQNIAVSRRKNCVVKLYNKGEEKMKFKSLVKATLATASVVALTACVELTHQTAHKLKLKRHRNRG